MSIVIVISSNRRLVSEMKQAVSKQDCQFEHYTEEQWELQKTSPNNVLPFQNHKFLPFGQKKTDFPQKSLNEIQLETIKKTLFKTKGNVSKVSKILCIGRATLYRKIKEYKIDLMDIRKEAKKLETEKTATAA